jgi:hypothetical protein
MRTLTTPASDSLTNGHTEWVQLSEHGNRQVKKHELVRLMVQSLQDLGYRQVVLSTHIININ